MNFCHVKKFASKFSASSQQKLFTFIPSSLDTENQLASLIKVPMSMHIQIYTQMHI